MKKKERIRRLEDMIVQLVDALDQHADTPIPDAHDRRSSSGLIASFQGTMRPVESLYELAEQVKKERATPKEPTQ
jgi:hypothetical protein